VEHDVDVVVVGGGHAGCEAAHVVARMGLTSALVTMSQDDIGVLSCNPAMGGIGKGHLIREIDALGGLIGLASDMSAIHHRLLNASKGPAVQGPRVQVCRAGYKAAMRSLIDGTSSLVVIEGEVTGILRENGVVRGVEVGEGHPLSARAVVLTTGTFLGGTIHVGDRSFPAGRSGSQRSERLRAAMEAGGLALGRLKTGTPPRLDGLTIDWDRVHWQPGDENPTPLSAQASTIRLPQVACGITETNARTHEVVRGCLSESPVFAGAIGSVGPRYCPSIEDKVVRFPDRPRHQVFLEPESLDDDLVYPNGISTAIGEAAQTAMVRTIDGLESCNLVQPGYAIEYTFVNPQSLEGDLSVPGWGGLFLAGQINGTTGYEEAAAQGLVAGVNAALRVRSERRWIPDRRTCYLGVLCDDITGKGVSEPYRMFTSRAENRLEMRPDTAWDRLGPDADRLGCLTEDQRAARHGYAICLRRVRERCRQEPVTEELAELAGLGTWRDRFRTVEDLLGLSGVDRAMLASWLRLVRTDEVRALGTLHADALYAGHRRRQDRSPLGELGRTGLEIPRDFDFRAVPGLSNEAAQRLSAFRPRTLAQAASYEGVTVAAVAAVHVAIRRREADAGRK
jgi:tRNA uridine 5-carboxymethylaminomethyl modification enzyme